MSVHILSIISMCLNLCMMAHQVPLFVCHVSVIMAICRSHKGISYLYPKEYISHLPDRKQIRVLEKIINMLVRINKPENNVCLRKQVSVSQQLEALEVVPENLQELQGLTNVCPETQFVQHSFPYNISDSCFIWLYHSKVYSIKYLRSQLGERATQLWPHTA